MKLRIFRNEAEAELEELRYELALAQADAADWERAARRAQDELDRMGARLCSLQALGLGSENGQARGDGDGVLA